MFLFFCRLLELISVFFFVILLYLLGDFYSYLVSSRSMKLHIISLAFELGVLRHNVENFVKCDGSVSHRGIHGNPMEVKPMSNLWSIMTCLGKENHVSLGKLE